MRRAITYRAIIADPPVCAGNPLQGCLQPGRRRPAPCGASCFAGQG